LAQGEVECRRLERPAPVLRLARLEERERVERVLADERKLVASRLELLLRLGVVVDLLAAALLAVPAQHHDRAAQRELTCDLLLERLQLVGLARERLLPSNVLTGHGGT